MSGEQLEPGTLLNERYRILRVIGKGGMGTVYQAEHVRLDTILAVKEVRAPQTEETDAQSLLEQCEHEARFLVRLHHPNLPQVTDAFLEDNRFFVVMEYIEGVTLEAKARMAGPGQLPVSVVIEWGLQIADVLAYLHSQDPPIIFRDLKPGNVMVQADGRIRLIDFGIARRFQPGAVKDTNLLGSVGYSPPEQFGRHQTDTRSDIYAFGATLHNLLTGKEPSHSPFKFASVSSLNPSIPDRLSRLIDCCVRLDADARPQSVHEVAMELLAIRDALPADQVGQPTPTTGAPESSNTAAASGSAKIILTNPTLRNTGKTARGSQKVSAALSGSGSTGSDRLAGPIPHGAHSATVQPGGAAVVQTPGASGTVGPERASTVPFWVVGIASAFVVCAFAVWMVKAQATHPPPGGGFSGVRTPITTPPQTDSPITAPHPRGTSGPAIVTPPDTGSVPLTALNRAVTFDSVNSPMVHGVSADLQGHPTLHLKVSGTAQGQPGDQFVIAAFFYDPQYQQVNSLLPQTPYSSKDGKLSVAASVTLTTVSQRFDLPLDLPISAVPMDITGGLQFHCVAFYGDQRIGETKNYEPISAATFKTGGGTQENPGASAPRNGEDVPGTSAPQRPGTFGSSPVRSD